MKRRLRFVLVAIGTAAILLLAWREIPIIPHVPNSGWTLFLMMLSFGVLATVLNFWLSVAKLKKARSAEIVAVGAQVVEDGEKRPRWMIVITDVAAAAYLGGICATLVDMLKK